MIDSTIVRAHHCAVGIKRGLAGHVAVHHQAPRRCDAKGRPLAFVLTPGQAHDVQGFGPLIRMIADRIDALLANKDCIADAIRQEMTDAEIKAVIPDRCNRIERLFSKLKNWRGVATCYDKTGDSYIGFVSLASALLWPPFVHVP